MINSQKIPLLFDLPQYFELVGREVVHASIVVSLFFFQTTIDPLTPVQFE